MPVFQITSPDGKTFEVTAPEGATPEQVLSYAQSQFQAKPPATGSAPRIEGALRGMKDPLDAAAQMFEHAMPDSFNTANHAINNWIADKTGMLARVPEKGGVDSLIKQQEQAYQSRRGAAGESGFDGARLVGNIASPVNLALAAKIPVAATLAGKIGAGVASGAASASLNPVDSDNFWAEKAKQVAIGAGVGGVMPVVTGAIGRMISPKASLNPDVALLKNEGVQPTVGQTLGGWANSAEEKLQAVPILGDAIRYARDKSRLQFNNAAINRATEPVGVRVSGAGQESVMNAGNAISNAYETGKASLGHFQIDNIGAAELANLKQMSTQLAPKEQGAFTQMWDKLQSEFTPNGSLTASSFKKIDSALNDKIGKFSGSSDAYQREAADALKELQRVILDNAKRANPGAAAQLKNADKAWAHLIPVEKASGAAVNHKGVFTPSQLNLAIRGTDLSARDRATARGTAIMQDLGNAGQAVLGDKVGDSGTAGRLLMGGGALLSGALNPMIPIGLGIGAAGYSAPAQNLLRALVSSRPQYAESISEMLKNTSPYLIPAAAQGALQLTKQ